MEVTRTYARPFAVRRVNLDLTLITCYRDSNAEDCRWMQENIPEEIRVVP